MAPLPLSLREGAGGWVQVNREGAFEKLKHILCIEQRKADLPVSPPGKRTH